MTAMIDIPSGSAALDEFLQALRRFKEACCVYPDRELSRLSSALVADPDVKIRVLRYLSPPVISSVLRGKRQTVPDWGFVATYILACLRFQEGTGATLDFDGPTDLQGWYEYYQAMLDRRDEESASAAASDVELAELTPEELIEHWSEPNEDLPRSAGGFVPHQDTDSPTDAGSPEAEATDAEAAGTPQHTTRDDLIEDER